MVLSQRGHPRQSRTTELGGEMVQATLQPDSGEHCDGAIFPFRSGTVRLKHRNLNVFDPRECGSR